MEELAGQVRGDPDVTVRVEARTRRDARRQAAPPRSDDAPNVPSDSTANAVMQPPNVSATSNVVPVGRRGDAVRIDHVASDHGDVAVGRDHHDAM